MISETSKYLGQELFAFTITSINPCQDDVTIHKFASFTQEIGGRLFSSPILTVISAIWTLYSSPILTLFSFPSWHCYFSHLDSFISPSSMFSSPILTLFASPIFTLFATPILTLFSSAVLTLLPFLILTLFFSHLNTVFFSHLNTVFFSDLDTVFVSNFGSISFYLAKIFSLLETVFFSIMTLFPSPILTLCFVYSPIPCLSVCKTQSQYTTTQWKRNRDYSCVQILCSTIVVKLFENSRWLFVYTTSVMFGYYWYTLTTNCWTIIKLLKVNKGILFWHNYVSPCPHLME